MVLSTTLVQILYFKVPNKHPGDFNMQIDENLLKISKQEKTLCIAIFRQETPSYSTDSHLYIEFQSCVTKQESWRTELWGSMSVSALPTMQILTEMKWISMYLKQKKLEQKLMSSWTLSKIFKLQRTVTPLSQQLKISWQPLT